MLAIQTKEVLLHGQHSTGTPLPYLCVGQALTLFTLKDTVGLPTGGQLLHLVSCAPAEASAVDRLDDSESLSLS